MSDNVGKGNGDEQAEEDAVDLRRLRARAVEPDGYEADGDVEELARDLMTVNLSHVSASWCTQGAWVRTNDRHF